MLPQQNVVTRDPVLPPLVGSRSQSSGRGLGNETSPGGGGEGGGAEVVGSAYVNSA